MNRSNLNASQPQGGAVTCPPCQITRPVRFSARLGPMATRLRRGYTIVELLMATLLTLILMYGVVRIFGWVGGTVSDAKSTLEMTDRLRAAKERLRQDLEWLTVTVWPPRRPEANEGVFEYREGPLGPVDPVWTVDPATTVAYDEDTGDPDSTVSDFDDFLLFTARSRGAPFIGRYGNSTLESYEAEIAWFVRGRTLYRRVLLIAPQTLSELDVDDDGVIDSGDLASLGVDTTEFSFFGAYDISARPVFDSSDNFVGWIPNTLGDLTKRENRFAHRAGWDHGFPYRTSVWGQLGLPTLRECSHPNWMTWNDLASRPQVTPVDQIDLWNNPHPWSGEVESVTGTSVGYEGPRIAEDVILTNVIGFDVKIWDPGAPLVLVEMLDSAGNAVEAVLTPGDAGYQDALPKVPSTEDGVTYSEAGRGAYVDLNYAKGFVNSVFDGVGYAGSQLNTGSARVYDTWSFHYEHDGLDQDSDGSTDEGTDGFDNDSDGVVDELGEMETVPPYPFRPRGIQVKIRCFEPDSRQVREVTVVVDFLTK